VKPRLLDLFCGAGGAAMGYHRAGFDVVGVDINPQPNYPFEFHHADATAMCQDVLNGCWHEGTSSALPGRLATCLGHFDAIHASPPCQRYSAVTGVSGEREDHPDLLEATRALLRASGLPYAIENVEGAPLENPVRLCGTTFPGLRVIRHRLFECSFPVMAPPCSRHPLLYVPDKRRLHQGEQDEMVAFVSVTGGGNCSKAAAAAAMGIDWMTKGELNNAIPPAYTEHIGGYLMSALTAKAAA
jgi:DNA (cytosine-5)-methyltransferase 1